ncbi:transposase [Streptomyces sp. NPDC127197]|uniref:transposase n=1 Tax=Streptomyces sp. NPDC127197 TaxID=3345388 RepID=UPI0036255301
MNARAAEVILVEIGDDIARFPRAADLASWAGVCPGNHESGGKEGPGKTATAIPGARPHSARPPSARRGPKDTYLAARYRRLIARRGKKRALVALEHSILIAVWHMFTRDTAYADIGGQYFLERTGRARQTRRLVSWLNQLGYQVTLQQMEEAA